ncbi:Zn-dependent peptidase ImmA, M78 family [Thermoanaerobacter thermohydrosulfuricus]|uniref:Zn-dependent peptidase ImmA, M78 family n=1 Tax=Thermoanaerobacter thermohydrosulfuricus TaxID=1516 RepID=A0A1G7WJX4_THETY|nr:ImmA/IrrE family metallo-endopeptidase [Thermoanaerobacter thermohydrosulfuricus]SDG72243.1 Zn-dependent peptidase ImmA, M78 family [Thermoanaerobacter thermohydrosulfuricus]
MNNFAETRALETRKELGLTFYEAVDVFKIFREIENISIIIMKMSNKMSGLFLRKGQANVIVINSRKSLGHQRFTAAHEYYHFKYGKGVISRICPIKKFEDDNPEEREANIFAINFLLPADGVKYVLQKRTKGAKIKINDIIFLEQYFGVSHQCMLIRLKELGIINELQKKEFSQNIITKAKEYGFSTQLYKNTSDKDIQVYSDYAEIAKKLLEANRISYGKYEELLIKGGYAHLIFEMEEETEGEISEFEDANSF